MPQAFLWKGAVLCNVRCIRFSSWVGTKLDRKTEIARTAFILENSTSSVALNRELNMPSWSSLAKETRRSLQHPSALNSLFKLPDFFALTELTEHKSQYMVPYLQPQLGRGDKDQLWVEIRVINLIADNSKG